MCLSIPAKIIQINGKNAKVSIGGTLYDASLELLENPKVGDFVLLHTGFAIQIISESDANETMKLLQEFAEVDQKIRDEENKEQKTGK